MGNQENRKKRAVYLHFLEVREPHQLWWESPWKTLPFENSAFRHKEEFTPCLNEQSNSDPERNWWFEN